MTGSGGIAHIFKEEATQTGDVRADQYGIQTSILVAGQPIKFEIVLEGRIELELPNPSDQSGFGESFVPKIALIMMLVRPCIRLSSATCTCRPDF